MGMQSGHSSGQSSQTVTKPHSLRGHCWPHCISPLVGSVQPQPSGQQMTLVPVWQTRRLEQHVLPISVVVLGHSHRQVSELTVPPSQATHWSPHGRAPGSSHWHEPSTQVCASPLQQMAKSPVPQTFAVGQQASPCKQVSPVWQHWVPQGVVPLWQLPSHPPPTHSSPASQRLKQLPQWRSFLSRFTHLSLQRVLPSGQAQTLSSPRLMQFLEQHWESLLHSLPKVLQSSAQASPGTEANAAPRRAPPIHLRALPLERVPVASPLASSSKERPTPPWGRRWCEWVLLCSSVGIVCLLPIRGRSFVVAPPRCSATRLPPRDSSMRPMGFAPPPYDGFALLASAHTDALDYKHIPRALAMNAPYTSSWPHATRLGGSLCIWTMRCVASGGEA